MKIAIILPTYNEKDNIRKVISAIFSLKLNDLHVVVVDDNSPDGTGIIVENLRKENERIHIIHRKKKLGLGTAYLEGFQYALENGAEHFFEVDADFSHDFSLLPEFLKHNKNHDLVIGSRYMFGGKIENWNFLRKLISQSGNFYARKILKIPIKDLTTGFKCYQKNVVEYLAKKNIDSIGYVFQVETTYLAYQKGFKIKEIPITFTERTFGKSKFDYKILWESFWRVLKLKFKNKFN